MDTTALSLCMDNGLPIYVFALAEGNIRRVALGGASARPWRERMIDDLIQDAGRRMDKSVESTHGELNSIRTGRASVALLDRVQVDYYGQKTPLQQLATINVPEPRMLTVQPFDPNSLKDIERAIQESDLGQPVQRRQDHPPADPAADRGAAPGAREGRAADRRGGSGRDPQRPA